MKKELVSQGAAFVFSEENQHQAARLIRRYPKGRQASALVPLLDLAQRQCQGWLPKEALEYIAHFLNLSLMHVYEVVTFYSMFNLKPMGKYFLQVCTTTPCQLSGAEDTLRTCRDITNTTSNNISSDGLFSVVEVECLGACIKAPVIQINDHYCENMDTKKTTQLLQNLKSGTKTLDEMLTESASTLKKPSPQGGCTEKDLNHET